MSRPKKASPPVTEKPVKLHVGAQKLTIETATETSSGVKLESSTQMFGDQLIAITALSKFDMCARLEELRRVLRCSSDCFDGGTIVLLRNRRSS